MQAQWNKIGQTVFSSLWFVPAILVFVGAGLALGLVQLEETVGQEALHRLPLLFGAGPEGARGMLSAIAGSVLGLAGITFSSTLVALSLAASTYTPRILRNFLRDRGNQIVLGTVLGTFVYCILALRTVRSGEGEFVPSLAVTGAIVLALADLGLFIYFIDHIAQSIQAVTITENIARDTRKTIDRVFPERVGPRAGMAEEDPVPEDMPEGVPVSASRAGYIQFADSDEMLKLTTEHDLVLWMERGIGDFVAEGAPLATLTPMDRANRATVKRATRLYSIGKERTFRQDAAFGIRQLVDIAIKALSPGINDVTTATNCVNYLGDLLRYLGEREMPAIYRRDAEGQLRVVVRRPSYTKMLDLAFDQIRVAGASQVAVSLSLLGVIEDLASTSESPDTRRALAQHAELIRSAADSGLTDGSDRERVRRALDRIGHILKDARFLGMT